MFQVRRSLFSVACCLTLLAGCDSGPRYVLIDGVLTLDGKPIAGAAISFTPEGIGEPSVGVSDEQGKFTVKTAHDRAGAVAGKHRISVFRAEMVPLGPGEAAPQGELAMDGHRIVWIVPPRYSRFEQSGLEADVKPGMSTVELKLTSQP